MAKVTKKPVSPKGGTAKKVIVENVVATPVMPTPVKPMNSKIISLALIVVVIGLLTYKLGPWISPAVVENTPLSRFELWSRLEKAYGAQVLDDMVNEKILDKAIAKSGVKIDESKLTDQIKALEKQFESTGGLEEALKERGLTRADLEKQVRTQLSVEELLADKINPSEEEIKKQFDSGSATVYKDKSFDDVKTSITDELKQAKLRDAFLTWFADIKKDTKVKTFGL